MFQHRFILESHIWEGEGQIAFSASPDKLSFKTEWRIGELKGGEIFCDQTVWVQRGVDPVNNHYTFYDLTTKNCRVTLENNMLDKVYGIGIIDPTTIAWEFRQNPGFDGFEIYKKLKNNQYSFHAEYSSSDQFRTIIDGKIESLN